MQYTYEVWKVTFALMTYCARSSNQSIHDKTPSKHEKKRRRKEWKHEAK
jgi:hypothetical protein